MTQMIIRIRTDENKAVTGKELSPGAVTINGQRFIPDRAPALSAARVTAGGDRSGESDPVELEIEVS